jgi:hypothetical protein
MTDQKVRAVWESAEEEADDIGNEASTLEEAPEERCLQSKLGDG